MARCHSLIRPAARAALLALACAATGAPAQPAEGAPQPAQAAQEYRIAPGALDDALARFATQAGISLDMPQPLAHALKPLVAAHIAALVGAPLPPRGPPSLA